jgi:hypothetical protein
LAACRAEDEEAVRAARDEQFEVDGIVGGKTRGKVVFRLVAWKGGAASWGTAAKTWEKGVQDAQVLELWQKRQMLQGARLKIKYSAAGWAAARVLRWSATSGHEVKYDDGEVEFLDLLHGEKQWKII